MAPAGTELAIQPTIVLRLCPGSKAFSVPDASLTAIFAPFTSGAMKQRFTGAGDGSLCAYHRRLSAVLQCRLGGGHVFAGRGAAFGHHGREAVEQVGRIVRAGTGFGVVLHGQDRPVLVHKTLQGLVVEIHVRGHPAARFERVGRHGEAVVLRSDFHTSSGEVADGLVGPAVAEFELEGLRPQGQSEQLMAQANAEDRHLAHDPFEHVDRVVNGRRVAGAVADEHAVGLVH